MDAPLDYEEMSTVFVWGGRSLLQTHGDTEPPPPYYRYAAEYIARLLDRLDYIAQESPGAIVTSVGALSAAVRNEMRVAYGDPFFDPNPQAITAQEGMVLARGQVAMAYLAYTGNISS